VLVDKDEAALKSVLASLADSGPALAEALTADLACPHDQDRVIQRIEQADRVSLLINNAGFGDPRLFHLREPQAHLNMLQVHVLSAVRFCRAVLPGMLEVGQGDIINVSSMAAELPVPGNVMYGATKGFLSTFSEILRVECASRGVNVQLLCPGYTRTEFHETQHYRGADLGQVPAWLWSPPEKVASSSLRALSKRRALCVPGLWNRCMYVALRSHLVPNWVVRRLLR
jgi:short-subunit dehydrogenase